MNADGYREVLGIAITSSEDGAGWLLFFRDLVAGGLSRVQWVTADADAGLVAAAPPAASGDAHYVVNLMAQTPKTSWPGCRRCCIRCMSSRMRQRLTLNTTGSLKPLGEKLPKIAAHLGTLGRI